MMKTDERRLRQVLLNLLSNGIKFTGKNGKISVSAYRQGGGIAISVADTGIGIAPEDIPKAMENFGQVRAAGRELRRHGIRSAAGEAPRRIDGRHFCSRKPTRRRHDHYLFVPAGTVAVNINGWSPKLSTHRFGRRPSTRSRSALDRLPARLPSADAIKAASDSPRRSRDRA